MSVHDEGAAPSECSVHTERLRKFGELIERSGLDTLVDDDLTALLGSFLELTDRLRDLASNGIDPGHLIDHWSRRTRRRVDAADRGAVGRPRDDAAGVARHHQAPGRDKPATKAHARRNEEDTSAGFYCAACQRTIPLAVAARLAGAIEASVRQLGAVASPSPHGGTAGKMPGFAREGARDRLRGDGVSATHRAQGAQTAPVASPASGRKAVAVDRYVGGRVREWREMRGVGQQELALRIGVTVQQVCKYERGVTRVSASRLFAIASALHAPISWFFDGFEETPSEPPRAE